MDIMIACCGLDCSTCDAYKATVNNDDELRKKVAQKWSELNHCEILPNHINCLGCRTPGMSTVYCSEMCEIHKCVIRKGFDTCGQCPEKDNCSIVAPMFENNPTAKDNLHKISE